MQMYGPRPPARLCPHGWCANRNANQQHSLVSVALVRVAPVVAIGKGPMVVILIAFVAPTSTRIHVAMTIAILAGVVARVAVGRDARRIPARNGA
jgi:hypothetical protein